MRESSVFPVSERNKLPGALRAAGCVRAQFRIDETARVQPADPELPAKEIDETPVSRVARAEGEGPAAVTGHKMNQKEPSPIVQKRERRSALF